MLTQTDLASPTWLKLKAHYEAKRQQLLAQMPGVVLCGDPDLRQAAAQAGRLAEINELLALAEQPIEVK